jgi:hypothetical protein
MSAGSSKCDVRSKVAKDNGRSEEERWDFIRWPRGAGNESAKSDLASREWKDLVDGGGQRQSPVGALSPIPTAADQGIHAGWQSQFLPEVTGPPASAPSPKPNRLCLDFQLWSAFPFSRRSGASVCGASNFPTQMAKDAVTRMAGVPVGFDQADVFVDVTVGRLTLMVRR